MDALQKYVSKSAANGLVPISSDTPLHNPGHRDALDSRLTNRKQVWDLCSPPWSCLALWHEILDIRPQTQDSDAFQKIGRQALWIIWISL